MKSRQRLDHAFAHLSQLRWRAATLLAAFFLAGPAQAALFTVNDAGDDGDFDEGDGVCETGSGVCTLRAAVEQANALAGPDDIVIAPGIDPAWSSNAPLDITSTLTLNGQGADQTTIDGNGTSRIFTIAGDGIVSIEGVTLTGGRAPDGESTVTMVSPGGSGGAIFNEGTLTITASALAGNAAGNGVAFPVFVVGNGSNGGAGGAIFNSGTLTIIASTLSSNRAGWGGDGNSPGNGGNGGAGGAIFNSGTLTITASTLWNNDGGNGGVGLANGNGGGGGAVFNTGTLTITNSTLSGNATGLGVGGSDRGAGGAIQNSGSGVSTITATTITNNTGRVGAAINQPDITGTLTLTNTLLADNTDPDVAGRNCFAIDAANDLIDGGGNLDDGNTCGFGGTSLVNATANLDALANNGGPTRTHALQAGSDAIDNDFAIAGCPATGQRGVPRPQDGDDDMNAVCDIGAFEVSMGPIPVDESAPGVGAAAIDPDDGLCSLIEAIANANDTVTGLVHPDCVQGDTAMPDTIILPAGASFTLNPAAAATDCFAGDNNGIDLGQSVLPPILQPLTLEGNGSIIQRADGAANCRIFTVIDDGSDDGALTLNDATIRNGVTSGADGGLDGLGGGLLNIGTVTLNRVTVADNTSRNTSFGGGGGLSTASSPLTLNRSTVSGNSAFSLGGGIHCTQGILTLNHSTVSGNSADNGGGLWIDECAATLTHGSVINNEASSTGAGATGGMVAVSADVTLRNSLIAANFQTGGGASPNCGHITSMFTLEGVNLTDVDTTLVTPCGLTEAADLTIGGAGTLGPLADNGGPTQTHALLPGSSAIDTADDTICTSTPDQRFMARPLDGAGPGVDMTPPDETDNTCDVGAYEALPAGTVLDFGDAPTTAQSGFPVSYPTLLLNNGAAHSFKAGDPVLGASVDSETDGQPNATATGDGNDENGVTATTAFIAGATATVTINVTGAGGVLDAWIDYNADGIWNLIDERISFMNLSFPMAGPGEVLVGSNELEFTIPMGVVTNTTTFARLRLSTAGGLDTHGLAPDGEVEDYPLIIAPVGTDPADVPPPLSGFGGMPSAGGGFVDDDDDEEWYEGCTLGRPGGPVDPLLWLLALLAATRLAWRGMALMPRGEPRVKRPESVARRLRARCADRSADS